MSDSLGKEYPCTNRLKVSRSPLVCAWWINPITEKLEARWILEREKQKLITSAPRQTNSEKAA